MVWFLVDDKLANHPKVRAAGLEAMGLWTVAGAYSAQYLTDGFVPAFVVTNWSRGAKLAALLCESGLWFEVDGGWKFHQWDEYQRTREQVEHDRAVQRERQQRSRAQRKRHADVTRDSQEDVTGDVTRDSRVVSRVSHTAHTNTNTNKELRTKKNARTRASDHDPDGFAEFWETYPRRAGRAAAVKAWRRAITKETAEAITAAAARYRNDPNRDDAFTKHAATWLNAEAWNDPPLPARGGRPSRDDKVRRALEIAASFKNDEPRQIGA